ncbi:MAG: YggS family pyridoxal phosphate-dependent enzyme [Gallionella sp.]|nr:YggS family pyridoxal phosphate-dependent enzyme [Gallionella sp.]MDD4960240.1 YggS family pyridoxal phosphate-dependent enzyme [Gallionella sp.]
MTTIALNLQATNAAIATATVAAGRNVNEIKLLAVSKTFPVEAIREAYRAGQRDFGESYVQEALPKLMALHDLPIDWHYIGPLQSNKTRAIAAHFAWVHSIDRLSIAQRLSAQRPADLPPLQVCLQVNVSGEDSKSGVAAADISALAAAVSALPNLTLRGLMAIPAPTDDPAEQRAAFAQVARIQQQLNQAGFALDTLSMGMSHDFPAAIAEGATIVRVGTAIFGNRIYP